MEKLVEEVYEKALAENAGYRDISKAEMGELIIAGARQIMALEDAGYEVGAPVALGEDVVRKLSAIWVFSGAGTYDGTVSPSAYSNFPWANKMDRERFDYALELSKAAFNICGRYIPIIYNGGDDQNISIKQNIEMGVIKVPESQEVHILGEGIRNTRDQIKGFQLPEALWVPGGAVGVLAHAPHLARITRMLNKYRPIPADMGVKLLPIKTAPEGKEDYMKLELKGILYYIFIAKEADKEPLAYEI